MTGMGSKEVDQIGDWPNYDKDLGTVNAKLAYGIRKKVLEGHYDPQDPKEESMLRDFKASKLSVAEFLKIYKR
jgi:hypothetical protein